MTKPLQKKTPRRSLTARQKNHKESDYKPDELTFIEHIYELRSRLFWVITSLIVASSVGYYIKDNLVAFILAPLHGEKLIYLTPGGGFSFIFTVCLYFGALITIPVIIYHIYRFLQPVLGKTSRVFVALLVLLSGSLAVGGALFGYMVAIPAAISFLTTFAGDAVTPSLTAESYLGFVVSYMLGLAALFQLPLLLFMFDHVRPFKPGALLSSQRFVVVGSIIAAALITPTPDIINQLIVAGPIIVIYQLGAIAVFVRRRLRNRALARSSRQHRAKPNLQAEPSQYPRSQPLPAVSAPLVSTSSPSVVPVNSTNVRRTVDGFSRRPIDKISIPKRPIVHTSKQVQHTSPGGRSFDQRRSVDGLSVV